MISAVDGLATACQPWNDTNTTFDLSQNVTLLAEYQAANTPAAIAVAFNKKEVTYAELNEKANFVAKQLVAHGVQKGHFIPIVMDRCLELMIAYIAVMKVGAAFVPAHENWPLERIKNTIAILSCPVVLISQVNADHSDD